MNQTIDTNVVKPELSFFENETLNRLLNFDRELILDSKHEEVDRYMKSNPGHGLSEIEKDGIYAQAQELYKEYKNTLREIKFNFHLNRPEYTFLTDLILKKLEYDVNTVFIAIELSEFLKGINGTKYTNDTDIVCFEVTATELTYIYHLIQNYKVKGLTKESYTFSKLLVRIGNVSKVINYYDAIAKKLPDEIQQWALKMDSSDVIQGFPIPETQSQ